MLVCSLLVLCIICHREKVWCGWSVHYAESLVENDRDFECH